MSADTAVDALNQSGARKSIADPFHEPPLCDLPEGGSEADVVDERHLQHLEIVDALAPFLLTASRPGHEYQKFQSYGPNPANQAIRGKVRKKAWSVGSRRTLPVLKKDIIIAALNPSRAKMEYRLE